MIRTLFLFFILLVLPEASESRLRDVLELARAKRLGRSAPSSVGMVDLLLLYRVHPDHRAFVTELGGMYQDGVYAAHEHDLYQNWQALYRGRSIDEGLEGALSELSKTGSMTVLSTDQTQFKQKDMLREIIDEIQILRRSKSLLAVLNWSGISPHPIIGAMDLNCEILTRLYEKHQVKASSQQVCRLFFGVKEKP